MSVFRRLRDFALKKSPVDPGDYRALSGFDPIKKAEDRFGRDTREAIGAGEKEIAAVVTVGRNGIGASEIEKIRNSLLS